MRSPRHFSAKFQRGFTLIEILIVIGIFLFLGAMSILMGMDSVGRSVVIEDRDILVMLLNEARANALANVGESRHGVHIGSTAYTSFAGNDLATSDVSMRHEVQRDVTVLASPLGGEVVFDRLSGDTYAGAGTITLSQDPQSLEIEINNTGRIEW